MDSVTGQAGVTIAVDDFKMFQDINGLWYTDTDGLVSGVNDNLLLGIDAQATGGGASIGVENLSVMVHINAITSQVTATSTGNSPGRDLQGDYSALDSEYVDYNMNNYAGQTAFLAKAIEIDVTDDLPVIGAGVDNNAAVLSAGGTTVNAAPVAGVKIELGTLEIVQSKLKMTVGLNDATPLVDDGPLATLNNGEAGHGDSNFGDISIGQTTMAILDGNLEIAPH